MRWHERAAEAIAQRLDGVVDEAVAELDVRVPEYARALLAAGEEPRTVCQGTVGLLLGALQARHLVIVAGSAVRRVGQARCEAGVTLDTLLEAISIQRDLLGRHLEAYAAESGADDAELRVGDRRLEQATAALTNSLTQGYMDAIRERGHRQRASAEAMVRVAAAVNASVELGEVGRAAVLVVTEVLGLDCGMLWLALDGEDRLALTYTSGLRWNEDTALRAGGLEGQLPLVERARRAGTAVAGSAVAVSGRTILGSAIAVALRSRGDLLGVLVTGSRAERAIEPAELAFATGAADHLAAALARAQRHRREARTDYLTGLANRTEFERELERLVAGAQRHGRPLALAILDLDGLKSINDRLGHVAGDRALRSVGRALVHGVRATDICARIGGDEFAVAMPDATELQAIEVIGRVRQTIRDAGFEVSAGVAAWTAGSSRLQLFKRADARLYREKRRHHRGRDTA